MPIRDIFTKDNIENLLNRISEMEKNKTLSNMEKEIKEFFENIDNFFNEFEQKVAKLRDYEYRKALGDNNKKFTNEVKEFVKFINKATDNYKHFTNMFNAENISISETTESDDLNKKTKTSSELFRELIESILNKFKK